MHAESRDYILSLCSDPNVSYARIWKEGGKTYIVIRAYADGKDYGYEGRMSSWKVPAHIRSAVNEQQYRLHTSA